MTELRLQEEIGHPVPHRTHPHSTPTPTPFQGLAKVLLHILTIGASLWWEGESFGTTLLWLQALCFEYPGNAPGFLALLPWETIAQSQQLLWRERKSRHSECIIYTVQC